MVFDTKYYDILQVPPTATKKEIKSSYLRLAKEFHPDKNPDGIAQFQEIAGAYEILSDDEKRKQYDQFGKQMLRPTSQTPDKQIPLILSLEDVYYGTSRSFPISRVIVCRECMGRGSTSKKEPDKCGKCQGSGSIPILQQILPGLIQKYFIGCDSCSGMGISIPETEKCKECLGKRYITKTEVIEVFIEKGMNSGSQIRIYEKSDEQMGMKTGDLIFIIQVEPHSSLKRHGDDLLMKQHITLGDALCGCSFPITIFDKTVVVQYKGILGSGQHILVKDWGMIKYREGRRGNLIIKIIVDMPVSLTDEHKKILKEILPVTIRDSEGEVVTAIPITPEIENNKQQQQAYCRQS